VPDVTLAHEVAGQETRVVRRNTTTPVRDIKADRPWTVPSVTQGRVNRCKQPVEQGG